MSSQQWLVLASLAAFAILAVGLTMAWRRGDETRVRRISPRAQAEADALRTGGWYIYRDGAVYFVPTDEQFLVECRAGRVLPYDLVFIIAERRWSPAPAVPLAGVVFPAPALTSSIDSRVLAFVAFLWWWSFAISQIRNIVERNAGKPVADFIGVGLIVSTCYVAWRYLRQRDGDGWLPKTID